PDDYNLPGYFGKERFTYYRTSTKGHNVPVLADMNQDSKAKAEIIFFRSEKSRAFAVADLTAAYRPAGALRVQRGIALIDGRRCVLLQDEIEPLKNIDLTFSLHTRAKVIVNGQTASLAIDDRVLEARLLSPEGASWSALPLQIPAPQKPASEITRLSVSLPKGIHSARIAIMFVPKGTPVPDHKVNALAGWEKSGP
ncbi:MAG: heparinase II/III family protein, partial [Oligoflexales bacterium]|nr:heparinase II/III family protein [Oligoflexales bacterium]